MGKRLVNVSPFINILLPNPTDGRARKILARKKIMDCTLYLKYKNRKESFNEKPIQTSENLGKRRTLKTSVPPYRKKLFGYEGFICYKSKQSLDKQFLRSENVSSL